MGHKYKKIDGQGNGGGCGICFCGCCCSRVAKCCLFIINTVFLLMGVVGIGVNVTKDVSIDDVKHDGVQRVRWIFLGLCLWVFLVSAFGCMSLCCLKKNKCYIVLYALMLVSLLAITISGASLVVSEGCDEDMSNPSKKSFEVYYPGNDFAKNMDYYQTLCECCGSRGVNDYINVSFFTEDTFVPITCCRYNPEYLDPVKEKISQCQKEAHEYQNGNTSHSFRYLKTIGCNQSCNELCGKVKHGIILVSFGLALLQILEICLSIGLWADARSKDRVTQ